MYRNYELNYFDYKTIKYTKINKNTFTSTTDFSCIYNLVK